MSKLKKRPDGRYVKTMTDPRTGKRVYFYGETEREINRKIMEFSGRAQRGRTFREVSDEWWEDAEPKLAIQSVHTYRNAKQRADAAFGSDLIKDIIPRDINLYLMRLASQGLARKTIANSRMVLNLICTHAVLENDILYNPCASVSIPKNLEKTKRVSASSTDEQIIKDNAELWLFPYIAVMTGMRKGEILALQWKDIDFEKKRISITKSVCFDGNRPLIKAPKTEAGIRTIPLLIPLAEKLLPLLPNDPERYIIADTAGNPLSHSYFMKLWSSYKKKTGIKCTPHQLRHSFATVAFECGVPPKTIQEMLGHRQLSTTMDIYTDLRSQSIDNAAQILNNAL